MPMSTVYSTTTDADFLHCTPALSVLGSLPFSECQCLVTSCGAMQTCLPLQLPASVDPLVITPSSTDILSGVGHASAIVSSPSLDILTLFLVGFVVVSVVSLAALSPALWQVTSQQIAGVFRSGSRPVFLPADNDLTLTSDEDYTLDEPSLASPSASAGSLSSSIDENVLGSPPSPLYLGSPAFQEVWKNNAQAVAMIAGKRRSGGLAVKDKLSRWAAKRHDLAVQEAVASTRESFIAPSTSCHEADGHKNTTSAHVEVISPRAGRKLRARRASLRALVRELEAMHAVIDNDPNTMYASES